MPARGALTAADPRQAPKPTRDDPVQGMSQRRLDDALVATVLEDCARWRLTCVALERAYGRWRAAPAGRKHAAYDTYVTALDAEDRAAHCYEASWRQADARREPLAAPGRSSGAWD